MHWTCPGTAKQPSASFPTGFRVAAPRVSVLLPTHNRADVLGYAIRSVLSQSISDLELLIVGDGCTDGTREVVGRFDDARITWFDLPKAPLSGYANRNVVLRQATGSVVAYAQHDDLWFPDHLELLLDTLARADAEWAYSRPIWIGPDGTVCPSAVDLTDRGQLSRFLNVENDIPSSCVIHFRSALHRIGYWPEDQAHIADWLCWQRILTTAVKPGLGYCPIPTNLHFRAAWRDTDSRVERAWRPIAQAPGWPPVLTHPPAGEPEQAVFWRAMTEQTGWISQFRDATRTILDRMAWTAIRDLLPRMEHEQAARTAAEAEANRARAETLDARATLRQTEARLQSQGEVALFSIAEAESQRDTALAATARLRQVSEDDLARLAVAEAQRAAAAAARIAQLQQAQDAALSSFAQAEAEREAALAEARHWAAVAAASDRDRAALQRIADSTIWRATRPLRVAVDAVKRMV